MVSDLLERIERGECSPYRERLGDNARWRCFMGLVHDRGIRYGNKTLDNFEARSKPEREVVERLRNFGANMLDWMKDGGGLILHGPEGTGKDHLQFALLTTAIVEHGFSVAWKDGLRLQDEFRRAIKNDRESDLLRELARPQILAISDPIPPKGDLSDYNVRTIRDLVDRRYQECKSTWITINVLEIDEAEPYFTPPLLARLKDASHVEKCYWESYRKPR